jgi:hypothetical protein
MRGIAVDHPRTRSVAKDGIQKGGHILDGPGGALLLAVA